MKDNVPAEKTEDSFSKAILAVHTVEALVHRIVAKRQIFHVKVLLPIRIKVHGFRSATFRLRWIKYGNWGFHSYALDVHFLKLALLYLSLSLVLCLFLLLKVFLLFPLFLLGWFLERLLKLCLNLEQLVLWPSLDPLLVMQGHLADS